MKKYAIEGGRRLEGTTYIIAGALLSRMKKVVFTYPGGYDF